MVPQWLGSIDLAVWPFLPLYLSAGFFLTFDLVSLVASLDPLMVILPALSGDVVLAFSLIPLGTKVPTPAIWSLVLGLPGMSRNLPIPCCNIDLCFTKHLWAFLKRMDFKAKPLFLQYCIECQAPETSVSGHS